MKDYQRRCQTKSTDSVIATLMGFDDLHNQRPSFEKRRVLPDIYVSKVASIALRKGSLVSIERSCCTNVSRGKNGNVRDKCVNLSDSNIRKGLRRPKSVDDLVLKSLSGASYEDREWTSQKSEHRHVLRYQQKLEHDSQTLDKSHLSSTSISGCKPKSGKVAYNFEDIKFDIHSRPAYGENWKSLMSENGYTSQQCRCKELVDNGIVPPRHNCMACSRTMNSISPQEWRRSKFEKVSNQGYNRKQKFERWKTAKEVQDFGFSGNNQTFQEMLALDKKSMPPNLDMRLCRSGLCSPSSLHSRSSESTSPLAFGIADFLESKGGRGSEQFPTYLGVDDTMSPSVKASELCSRNFSCFGSSYDNPLAYIEDVQDEIDSWFENDRCKEVEPSWRNSKSSNCDLAAQYINDASHTSAAQYINNASHTTAEAFAAGVCTRIDGDPQSESDPGILSGEGGHSCNGEEVFSTEASLNEFSEGESAYSNSSGIGPPESLENLKRTNQHHSPVSVLERFSIKNAPFECLDSIGLRLRLEALNFESEESHSEGSVMVVSGEEDPEEQFSDLSHDGRRVRRWFGDYESRNFSYLVDVIDEAGFRGMNSFLDFKIWYSLERPISPLVFEALEDKYGKQTSWEKSERQLLFDRINSGLVKIFYPVINFHASATTIRRRFCSSRRDEFEDELWKMLISQENENSKDLSEKDLDKWSEVEDGINIICRELETSLFHELVMEFASLRKR